MTKFAHTCGHMMIASAAAVLIISGAAVAQPPAGGKGKGARGSGNRAGQGASMRDPTEMAGKMIA